MRMRKYLQRNTAQNTMQRLSLSELAALLRLLTAEVSAAAYSKLTASQPSQEHPKHEPASHHALVFNCLTQHAERCARV